MSETTRILKACPQCLRTFPEEIRFCGLCGVKLVERSIEDKLSMQPALKSESSYIGTIIDERYRIKELVGRGGMGSVYLVEHIHMQRELAMKLLHEDLVVRKQLVSRFTREARAVSRLNNKHTVRVFDFGRHAAVFYLVMEYLDGEDLEMILEREGALPWRRALVLLDQICQSLEEAHEAGIIHRDLKPENIMIIEGPDGEEFVKVLDFGLAKIRDTEDVFTIHSQRDLFGTPFYMSPEQVRSKAVDHRADIYALGCLLYRLLTDQHAFDAPFAFDVLRQHLKAPIPSVIGCMPDADIPERVDRLIATTLAKSPGHRFVDAAALRAEIAGCLDDPDAESNPVPVMESADDEAGVIDEALEARLRAFEAVHNVASVRANQSMDDVELTVPKRLIEKRGVDIPVGIVVEEDTVAGFAIKGDGTYESTNTIVDQNMGFADNDGSIQEAAPKLGIRVDAVTADGQAGSLAEQLEPEFSEMDIDDANEFFERRLKRGRQLRVGVVAIVVVILSIVGTTMWSTQTSVVSGLQEHEPNNLLKQANSTQEGKVVSGHIGKRIGRFESDRDVYLIETAAAGEFLSMELSGIHNLNLAVDVLDPSGRPLTRVDYEGIGQGESLHRFRMPTSNVYLVVLEIKAGEVQPTENISDEYKLVYQLDAAPKVAGEVEPNDVGPAANAYKPGTQFLGFLDGRKDVDYFRVTTDGVLDLRRWEFDLTTSGSLVPELRLYRVVGDDKVQVFYEEGKKGLLKSAYEEPSFPNPEYLVEVAHAGRGDIRGEYSFTFDLLPSRPAVAHEPDDDRARATPIIIGQEVNGVLEASRDQDVFEIPVAGSKYRTVEIKMERVFRDRVQLVFSDTNNVTRKQYPPRRPKARRMPQPQWGQSSIRFSGQGERYYLTIRARSRRARDVAYTFRVQRLMTHTQIPVGGPGY